MKALRSCKDCGLQAFTLEDLELFHSSPKLPYGKMNWCKKCSAKYARERYPPTKMQEAIDNLKHPIICHFCGTEITKLKGNKRDSLVIHSLDRNHENWNPENKVPAHNGCHISYHMKHRNPEIYQKVSDALTGIKRSKETKAKLSKRKQGPNNPAWKGDKASKSAKWMREYRRRKKQNVK